MIDLYCERVGAGLWAEPVNALTNLSFLIAAFATWQLAKRLRMLGPGSWLLIALMAAMGVGSALFHTHATRWAMLLDVIPIALYQVSYLWLYAREVMRLCYRDTVLVLAAFLAAWPVFGQFPDMLNGSLLYAPALLLLLAFSVYHFLHLRNGRTLLFSACAVFLTSLTFRTIDLSMCAQLPLGTHFLWHLLNGVLLYLTARAFLLGAAERRATSPSRPKPE